MRLIGWIRQRLDRLSELQLNIYAANASFFILLAAIPSLMLILAVELAKDSGLNISQLPVVGCAPEWMSEKAVSIGNYVVASGLDTYLGVDPYVSGSSEICDLLTGEDGINKWVEAKYTVEKDIEKLGDMMIERIEQKRAALGI